MIIIIMSSSPFRPVVQCGLSSTGVSGKWSEQSVTVGVLTQSVGNEGTWPLKSIVIDFFRPDDMELFVGGRKYLPRMCIILALFVFNG